MDLDKIKVEDLKFTDECEQDRTNTFLALDDYDWMNYTLSTKFNTDEYGKLDIKFNFFGMNNSTMKVTRIQNNETIKYEFSYSTNIFIKHITIFMTTHINSWNSNYAFDGESNVLDFYNEVIEIGELQKEEEMEI